MLVAYAAASRSSGRADQDGGGTRRRAPRTNNPGALTQQPRQTSSYADFRPSHPLSSSLPTETLGKLAGLRLRCRKLPSGPWSCSDHVCRAGADTIRTGPQGLSAERGCRSSPRRRRTSRAIRVPMRPPRAAPLRALRPRAPRFTHPVCRAPRPLRGTKTLFNSST